MHNAKLPKSFNSAIWKKGYNPDLIIVSLNISDMCEKFVLDPIPRTQHRPICVTVHPVIVPQPTPFRRRFNLNGTISQRILMKPLKKWNLSQKTTIDSYVLYVWCPEDTYQGGVGQTTYLVSRKSHRAYMKHTRNSTLATLLPKEPWRLETS